MAEINLSIFAFIVHLGKKWKGGFPIRVQKASRRQSHFFFFIFFILEEDIEEAGTRKLLRRSHTMCMSLIPSSLHTTEAEAEAAEMACFFWGRIVNLTDGRHDAVVGDDNWAAWRRPKSKRNLNLWRLVGRQPLLLETTNSGKIPL